MREILFRAKTTDGSRWVIGDIHFIDNRVEMCSGYVGVTVDSKTVGQYTGMKDKNGNRIFEGDICKVRNLLYKVEFIYSCWWFTILSSKVYCCPAFNSHCGEYCEIVGNIHDNPELLENH